MTAIWQETEHGWQPLQPAGFIDEKQLHSAVEGALELLPLAGRPQVVVLGSEVYLGGKYADLVAIETTGRPVLVEVKLGKNPEAKWAIIAQILTYAAFLRGLTPEQLETEVLASNMAKRGLVGLATAAREKDQGGSFDEENFTSRLAEHLATGSFRLVLVLDSAPDELVRLVGYLQSVSDQIQFDLITVTPFEIGGRRIVVPQRVEPEQLERPPVRSAGPAVKGQQSDGAQEFEASLSETSGEQRELLEKLLKWAKGLEADGLARLFTYKGKHGEVLLLPRFQPDNVGFVTIWNDHGQANLAVWRSVFEKKAPGVIPEIERLINPIRIGQGNWAKPITDELLNAISAAYRQVGNK